MVNINAERCAEYLRFIGIPVSAEEAAAWAAQETSDRARRRAHNRELKRSCGHFRTYPTTIIHEGGRIEALACLECHKYVRATQGAR